MNTTSHRKSHDIYRTCREIAGSVTWQRLMNGQEFPPDPELLIIGLERMGGQGIPEFLPDLARLEWAIHEVEMTSPACRKDADAISLNPSLRILEVSWQNLTELCNPDKPASRRKPESGREMILLWKVARTGAVRFRPATSEDLLSLKMISEAIPAEQVAAEGNLPVGAVDALIDGAVMEGILNAPPSGIRRDPRIFRAEGGIGEEFLESFSFTLQWHVTQACDLQCRHCYDRSNRSHMQLAQAVRVLDDLRVFCRSRHVMGAVSFTGGNPFLYPGFIELYRAASERGFSLAILGNPTRREILEELLSIQMPTHIQVSLEGLPEHNDYIRGRGHFDRVMEFLRLLRELGIFSMVMLTLTRDNMHQIIPLAELLRDYTDRFHFNRLSMVGEGANLVLPERDAYRAFLEEYEHAVQGNPVLGLKDNMFNILRHERNTELFGGCAGYGCGAAFNFLALLPDGEVHACRKLPSYLGNIFDKGIAEIYDSAEAGRYRSGCTACTGCAVRAVCGGCLAVAYSHGLNIFEEKDPFCFMPPAGARQ